MKRDNAQGLGQYVPPKTTIISIKGLGHYVPPKLTIAGDKPTKSSKIASYMERYTKWKQARDRRAGEATDGNPVSPYEGITLEQAYQLSGEEFVKYLRWRYPNSNRKNNREQKKNNELLAKN